MMKEEEVEQPPSEPPVTTANPTSSNAVAVTATPDRKMRITLDAFPGDVRVLTTGMRNMGVTLETVNRFRVAYKSHCQSLLDNMLSMSFVTVQELWMSFWSKVTTHMWSNKRTVVQIVKECTCNVSVFIVMYSFCLRFVFEYRCFFLPPNHNKCKRISLSNGLWYWTLVRYGFYIFL